MLRGALAAGCSLWVPMALSGCKAKQGADSSTSPVPANPPATDTNPAAPKKIPQVNVQYRAQPKGEQKCGRCLHFMAGANTCELVEGQISAEGWCSLWARKA
ncbi:MAG: high-potential iron-sulfur protein [Leptothrix sp. (in: b-proteobacteria)]